MTSFQDNGTIKPNQISSQVICLMTVRDVISSQVKCLMTVQDVIYSQVKCLMTVQDVISSQVGMIRSIFTWFLMTQWIASNSRPCIVFFQVMDVYIPLSNLFKYGCEWLFRYSPFRVPLCRFKLWTNLRRGVSGWVR